MSIFTTALAFKDEELKDIAKIAILISVVTSVLVSWLNFSTVRNKAKTNYKLREQQSIRDSHKVLIN